MVKIAVRPIKGEQFQVEIEPEATVQDLKKKISETNKDFPADLQKLIHSGKILQDATKVQEAGIKEGEFVVVMVTKAKAPGTGASSVGPAALPTPVAMLAPAATVPAAAPPDTDVPISYETAAASLVTGGAMERTIQQLIDMGYPRQEVERALQAAFNNPDRAVEYLISGIPEGMTQAAPAPVAQTTPTPAGTPPLVMPAGGGAGAVPFPAMTAGGGRAASPESLAALQELRNNPRFPQIAQMVTANPQSLAQMLPALQQAYPDLLRAITEHPDAFMQMVTQAAGGQTQDPVDAMLAAGGQGGTGPMPGGPGGPVVVRLSEEERAAVERLAALGFDSQMAIQAYLACDKNEEMAANFLFDNGDS